ncbi:unnamed protein product [Arctogadus glacialis]
MVMACSSYVPPGTPMGQQVQADDASVPDVGEPNLMHHLLVTHPTLLPLIPVSCPVTDIRRTLVDDHPPERAPVVPGKTPGRTREMVDPVSTKALQGRPSRLQRRHRPLRRPVLPTRALSPWRGEGFRSGGPLNGPLCRSFLPDEEL